MPDNRSETPDLRPKTASHHDLAAIRYLTIGKIVCELMSAERPVNRKTICCKLLKQLEQAQCAEEKKIYHRLIRMLLGRN